jgi:DNA polymerase I
MLKLPNVRRLFRPSPGYLLCDVDLSGADAQVVAWEAEDEDLKNAFRSGTDIHNHNGRAIWRETYDPKKRLRKYTMRDELKRAVHGSNYAAGARTLSTTLGWSQAHVRAFQAQWFSLHPGIRDWHRRVERSIQTTRSVHNRFGYRIVYFDRPDNLLPKALAWIPQSTVAGVCARGALQLSSACPWVHLLLQVHDSLVFQVPAREISPSRFRAIYEALKVEIPYPDPLTIPWSISTSTQSWGDVKKQKWEELT